VKDPFLLLNIVENLSIVRMRMDSKEGETACGELPSPPARTSLSKERKREKEL